MDLFYFNYCSLPRLILWINWLKKERKLAMHYDFSVILCDLKTSPWGLVAVSSIAMNFCDHMKSSMLKIYFWVFETTIELAISLTFVILDSSVYLSALSHLCSWSSVAFQQGTWHYVFVDSHHKIPWILLIVMKLRHTTKCKNENESSGFLFAWDRKWEDFCYSRIWWSVIRNKWYSRIPVISIWMSKGLKTFMDHHQTAFEGLGSISDGSGRVHLDMLKHGSIFSHLYAYVSGWVTINQKCPHLSWFQFPSVQDNMPNDQEIEVQYLESH